MFTYGSLDEDVVETLVDFGKVGSLGGILLPAFLQKGLQAGETILGDRRSLALDANSLHKFVVVAVVWEEILARINFPQTHSEAVYIGFLVERFIFHDL
mgnify:FL=1